MSEGRFDTPTQRATPGGLDEPETIGDRPNGSERAATPAPGAPPALSVFDPPRSRFEEQKELGRGGMGRVVEARDLALDRPVAIKHLLAGTDEDLARFEREVRITARLQHPSIVPILDAGRDEEGMPFYIMRKIDGEPLSARVEAATTVRDRIALIPAVLGAIDAAAYAHAQGVIHRDIKPWNILLGPFGETLLIDWGIARELAQAEIVAPNVRSSSQTSGLTRVGDAVGTPGFMAPEQARGDAVDTRADVYSLGATLYFVLTGALPFEGSSATIAISEVAAGAGPDLQAIPDEVPAELSAIVIKALAPERFARYADASELAADLRRFLTGQLVAAHRYTTGERVVRWVKRHLLVTAISTIAVIAITVTAILSFRSVVAQRDQAREATALAEARAEELLVDRARMTVATDPTSAIALLRSLPTASKLWPTAREIVRAAIPAGVERGLISDETYTYGLQFGPDGRLARAGDKAIEVHDLGMRTHRALSNHTASRVVWLDGKTLAFTEMEPTSRAFTVGVIDTESGEERSLPARELQSIAALGDSVVIHNSNGSLDVYDATLKGTRVVTQGVVAIDVRNDRLLVAGLDAVRILERSGEQRTRNVVPERRPLLARLSASGKRVALMYMDEIVEMQIENDAPPRRWQRSSSSEQGMAYVGDTLWAWDDSGGGLVSLDRDVPITRWAYRGAMLTPSRFRGGLVLATQDGRIAYVDSLGVVEIPHRRLHLKFVEVSRDGQTLALAAINGDIMAIDLRPVRPHLAPVAETTSLFGNSADKLVIGDATTDEMGSMGTTKIAILDLATGTRTELGDFGFSPFVTALDTVIVVGSGPSRDARELTVWGFDGREKLRVPLGSHVSTGVGLLAETSVFYTTPGDDLVEQPLEPFGPARVLRRMDGERVSRLIATPQGVSVSTTDLTTTPMMTQIEWFELGPRKAPNRTYPGWAFSPGFGPDNAWWVIEDLKRLIRIAPDGTRRAIALPQSINAMAIKGKRIWAIGSTALYQLAPDGTLQRTVALPVALKRGNLIDGIASLSDDGVFITMPEANVSRLLPLPGGADQQVSTSDGRFVAVRTRSSPPYIAVWNDPVPVDPAALPAFLETLTNARLDLASSTVTWDRNQP